MSFKPKVEPLEDRLMPAFIASQLPAAVLNQPLTLTTAQVDLLLQRAAAASGTDDAIIAVVDRNGRILGVRVEGAVSPLVTGNTNILNFAIDGAVAKARTAAFFSTTNTPLTSRTIRAISETTMTEREVNSYTFISNPNSTNGGPGFVAPIGIAGHFPPGVANTPQVDLFGIEHTNRDMLVNPGPNSGGILFTPSGGAAANQVTLQGRFNIDPAFVPAGKTLTAPLSYHDTLLPAATPGPAVTAGGQDDPNVPHVASRGIATLPGGIPLFYRGTLVGGIGVFFPGKTGFASEENSDLSANFDPNKVDRSREAEFIAFAAAGGSKEAGVPVGAIGSVPALTGFDLKFPRIDLVGITLDVVGPNGARGPERLLNYISGNVSAFTGNPFSGVNRPVNSGGATLLAGTPAPEGYLVTPHAGNGISAAQVQQVITQGIKQADQTRAQIRDLGLTTRMVFSVADSDGNVLGLYRMPDSPVFSINVAVAKSRNTAYYNDPTQLLTVDQLNGIPAGTSFTARTFRFLALPRFPEGIDTASPGPFSQLNDNGINRNTALNVGAPQPINNFKSVFGFDSFHPNTNFRKFGANASGIVFFPGSSSVYVGGQIRGGFGVSGDGVDEDDVVTSAGAAGFGPASSIQVDRFFFRGVRLPYQKFNRNPQG